MEISKIDLRTDREKERDKFYKKMCGDYKVLLKENPDAKPYRLMGVLSMKYNLSTQRIAIVLIKYGLYKVRTHKSKNNDK